MGSLFIPSLHLTESEVHSIGGDFLRVIFLSPLPLYFYINYT